MHIPHLLRSFLPLLLSKVQAFDVDVGVLHEFIVDFPVLLDLGHGEGAVIDVSPAHLIHVQSSFRKQDPQTCSSRSGKLTQIKAICLPRQS